MSRTELTDLEEAAREAGAGRWVIVRHGGKRLVVLPAEDFERLEDLEDAAEGRAALAELEAGRDHLIPASEVRRRLGKSR